MLEKYEKPESILQKLKDLELSKQRIAHRIQDLSNNIKDQLIQNLKNCKYFSLVLDESCDMKDTAQWYFGYILYQRTSKFMEKHQFVT